MRRCAGASTRASSKRWGKYFDGGYSGHVTVGKEGFGFRTECAVHLDSGITLQAEGMAADAYASADQAAIRIEKRLRRYHRRLKDRPLARTDGVRSDLVTDVEAPSYVIAAPEHDDGRRRASSTRSSSLSRQPHSGSSR